MGASILLSSLLLSAGFESGSAAPANPQTAKAQTAKVRTTNRFGLPKTAVILETGKLPAVADRTIVLWMLKPEKHPYTSGEIYSCVDRTRGSYYTGVLNVSLVNSATNQLINTLTVEPAPDGEEKTLDIPYSIRAEESCYKVPGASGKKDGKPKIIDLVDMNGDGKAQEFVLYDAQNCMLLYTSLIGYSARQDKVIQYPVQLNIRDTKEKSASELRKWVVGLFSRKRGRAGCFKYEVDFTGREGPLEKFEVKYNPGREMFTGTLQRSW
jgi:hypothetical protein